MTHFRRMIFVFRSWAGRVAGSPTLSKSERKLGRLAGSAGGTHCRLFPASWPGSLGVQPQAQLLPLPFSPAPPAACSTVTSLYANKEDRQMHYSRKETR